MFLEPQGNILEFWKIIWLKTEVMAAEYLKYINIKIY